MSKPTDEICTNPTIVAEARAIATKAAEVKPELTYSPHACMRDEYEKHMLQETRGKMTLEMVWQNVQNLARQRTGEIVGALTEDEYRRFCRAMIFELNANYLAERYQTQQHRCQAMLNALHVDVQIRLNSDGVSLSLDGEYGLIRKTVSTAQGTPAPVVVPFVMR